MGKTLRHPLWQSIILLHLCIFSKSLAWGLNKELWNELTVNHLGSNPGLLHVSPGGTDPWADSGTLGGLKML